MCLCPSDVLVSLPVSEAPLQNHIHALCEAWWKKGLQEKERFGRTAFFVSLQKSFILKKPVSHMSAPQLFQQVFTLKEMFSISSQCVSQQSADNW